jgi:hypothetical protein
VLQCWWGGGRTLGVVRDDGGNGCVIALLGWWQYQGVRAVEPNHLITAHLIATDDVYIHNQC